MRFSSALVQVFSNCAAQSFRAPLQRARLVVGHLRQERLDNALPSDHARQRQRDTVARVVGANREYRALISQHDLGEARGDHADAVLACAEAFDDRDIGKAHVLFHLAAEGVKAAPSLRQRVGDVHPADPRRRPEEYARSAVLANHVGFDTGGADGEAFGEMHAEPQAVKIGARADHSVMTEEMTGDIDQRPADRLQSESRRQAPP
jgi:hypothetical protein